MGTTNVTETLGLTIASSWRDASVAGNFRTLVNANLDNTNGLNWIPVKFGGSVIDACKDFVELTGGDEQVSIAMGTNNNFFETFGEMEIFMPPGYSLTLCIEALDNTTDS
jgi:hypothetical protein